MPAKIKGATLINALAIVREIASPARLQALIDACPTETQQLMRRTLMAIEWISVDSWSPFLQILFDQLAARNEDHFRRLLRSICKRDFSSVYRIYIQGATPATILNKAPNIWSAYFDSGSLTTTELHVREGASRALLQMRDLETSSSIYAMTVHAYIEQLLIMTGAQTSTVQRLRETHRDTRLSCDFAISFS